MRRPLRRLGRNVCTERALRACLALGVIEARLRPDGQLGYYLTPAGQALRAEPTEDEAGPGPVLRGPRGAPVCLDSGGRTPSCISD